MLRLNGTLVGDAGLRHLLTLKSLRELELNNTNVTDTGLECIASLPALQTISVKGTTVTRAGVERLGRARPDVRVEYTPSTLPAADVFPSTDNLPASPAAARP